MDTDDDVRLARRIKRDTVERGRDVPRKDFTGLIIYDSGPRLKRV